MKQLVVVTALMAEAVPLVDFYRMDKLIKNADYHHYRVERDPGQLQLDLLVCGLGADRAQRAILAYLKQPGLARQSCWLNLGIAGARDHEIGELVWAHHVGGRPVAVPTGVEKTSTAEVVSLAEPGLAYRAGVLFDMEAETCLQTLSENLYQFSPEQLFCAKVISDNPARGLQQISKQWVTKIIRKQIESLDRHIHNIISTIE